MRVSGESGTLLGSHHHAGSHIPRPKGTITPFDLEAAKTGIEEMQTENGYFALLARRGINDTKSKK